MNELKEINIEDIQNLDQLTLEFVIQVLDNERTGLKKQIVNLFDRMTEPGFNSAKGRELGVRISEAQAKEQFLGTQRLYFQAVLETVEKFGAGIPDFSDQPADRVAHCPECDESDRDRLIWRNDDSDYIDCSSCYRVISADQLVYK